ncbi:multidrug effflux MFS transporter [Leisingera sp. M523]|uniref:multidrug effflux MFS transporter n=1 Tax=Leisingera sp. M523 TaxID=2867013 RepID=UPI0021A26991|nr:multidrug effflux MFS transporter [Leisingera sp. M523]UWQ28329.1 multidrug effflux MFS transporter [Leisingera sp. M523]
MMKAQTPPALVTLILLTAFSTLSLNMFLPSLASIATDLDASYATVSLAVAGYLATTAVIQLIVGPLSDRVGRRPVLLTSLFVFAGASVICAFAADVWTFLVFRMLQGGMISGYALSLAIVRDTTSERKAAGLIGYISMAMAIAPMLGPMLGGLLDAAFGWRANFYFYAVSGCVLFAICWMDLGETKPARSEPNAANPEGMLDLLKEPRFWAFSFCSAFSTGAFYIFLTGVPLVAQSQFGMTTAELGFSMGTITAGFMLGGFIAGRFAPKFEPTTMMMAGRLTACFGISLGIAAILLGFVSPVLFFGSTVFVGLGNGITMPSSNASAMSVRPNLAGSAAGLNGALIVAGGAVLTTLTGLALPTIEPALMLLILMLAASASGLVSALLALGLRAASEELNVR